MMNETSCRHLASALLPWYLNGALAGDKHAMVREHVEGCDLCALELAELEAVARDAAPPVFTRESPHHTVSPAVAARTPWRRAWVLAAAIALPAILGLVWILIGVARGR